MPHAKISAPSLTMDPGIPWSLYAPHPSTLPYSFRHTLQRIKRKTHGRTRAQESSWCVRPFRRGQGEDRVEGRRSNVVVYAAGSHKGTFRDRRLVIRRRFRKGLFCSRWPQERALPSSSFTRFSQPPRASPADLLSIVLLLIGRNFISITSYFDRSQAGSFDLRRLPSPPFAFPCESNYGYTLHL